MTLEDLGLWLFDAMSRVPGPWLFVSVDKETYDGSLPACALNVEFNVYERYGCPRDVINHLRKQMVAEGYTRHGVYYKRKGSRSSGVNNTTSGNTMLNAASLGYWFERAGVPLEHTASLVQGDDSASVVSSRYESQLRETEGCCKELGLTNKVVYSNDPYDVEFCSKRPYPVAESCPFVFGPMIGRVLAKQGYAMSDYNPAKSRAWLRGVALSLERDVAHIPLLGVLV